MNDMSVLEGLKLAWQFFFAKPVDTRPALPVPVLRMTRADIDAAPDGILWRVGHSTVLLKLDGRYWITDPVFSERASPLSWVGPQRFHAPAIELSELPPLAAVILSHDHYDHLDKATIRALARRAEHFLAPKGVGDLLADWGVPQERITQLAWWESTTVHGVQFTLAPAKHFSGRGLFDRNQRLWGAWAIRSAQLSLFFGGDSGYFDGFKAIGERLGPFDLTMLEAGAYDRRWLDIHMLPEQTVQAHQDLRGRRLLPIHNGTFDLAMHAWTEPMERVLAAAAQQNVVALTPRFGERVDIAAPAAFNAWWRAVPARTHQPLAAVSAHP